MKRRILFTSFSLLSVLIWGSFAQGWRLFETLHRFDYYYKSYYAVYLPYFHDRWNEKKMKNSRFFPAIGEFRSSREWHFRRLWSDEGLWAEGSFYYDEKAGRYCFLKFLENQGPYIYYQLQVYDERFELIHKAKRDAIGAGSSGLVKVNGRFKDKTSGEITQKTVYAIAERSADDIETQSKPYQHYLLMLNDEQIEKYELKSEHPESIELLRPTSWYKQIPTKQTRIDMPRKNKVIIYDK